MILKKRSLKLTFLFTIIVSLMAFLVYAVGPTITIGASPSNISNSSFQAGSVTFNITTNINSNLTINITNTTGSVKGQIFSNLNTTHLKIWATNNGSYADGAYNITIIAFNSTNASEISTFVNSIVNVTVDNTYPGNQNVSTSAESTSTSVTWYTSESANSSVNYGPSISLGTTSSGSDLVSSRTIQLSELTSGTFYYYNVTSCDRAFNCNTTGPYNFTTSDEVVESSSSSSSGTGPSYVLTESLKIGDSAEETMTGIGAIVKFDLPNGLGRHSIELKSVNGNLVTFVISSNPMEVTLSNGEEKKIDINNDGVYDLSFSLVDFSYISTNRPKVNIEYTVISESVTESTNEQNSQEQTGKEPSPRLAPESSNGNTSNIVWIIGIILVLVIVWIIAKKKLLKNNR